MSRVSAVILAAGKASRAGGPKTVWPVEGVPSVRRVAEAALAASAITEVLAVTGAWSDEVEKALSGLEIKKVYNSDYTEGQSGSLAVGLRAVDPEAEAAIFLLADQPFITSQIIDDLVKFMTDQRATMAAPFFRGMRRNPVVFDLSRWRGALLAVTGDRGGRNLIEAYPEELALRCFDDTYERCFGDFDTPADYERLTNERKTSDNN